MVREGGRWFVSPVGTVLDMVDSFVAHVDERTLYPLIGLGYLLPPDATLTLNQPMSLPSSNAYNHVLAFDGTAGQEVIGQVEGSTGNDRFDYYLSGRALYRRREGRGLHRLRAEGPGLLRRADDDAAAAPAATGS